MQHDALQRRVKVLGDALDCYIVDHRYLSSGDKRMVGAAQSTHCRNREALDGCQQALRTGKEGGGRN
jgi:hypothetical protein